MHGLSRRSQIGCVTIGVVFYSLWELWKHRCKLKFEGGTTSNPHAVIHATLSHARNMNNMASPKRRPTHWERSVSENLAVEENGCIG